MLQRQALPQYVQASVQPKMPLVRLALHQLHGGALGEKQLLCKTLSYAPAILDTNALSDVNTHMKITHAAFVQQAGSKMKPHAMIVHLVNTKIKLGSRRALTATPVHLTPMQGRACAQIVRQAFYRSPVALSAESNMGFTIFILGLAATIL